MAKRDGQLSLGAFLLYTGHHVAAWRHPDASDSTHFSDFADFARIAENAKFDAVFLADGVNARVQNVETASRKAHSGFYPFEPITLLSALAAVTSRIGLVATASTSFSDPYNLARQFASLDHLSGGRAGWNLVTSAMRSSRMLIVTSGRKSSSMSSPVSGTRQTTMRSCGIGRAASIFIPRRFVPSIIVAHFSRFADR
jgi:hypothetical protein